VEDVPEYLATHRSQFTPRDLMLKGKGPIGKEKAEIRKSLQLKDFKAAKEHNEAKKQLQQP
jgi:hypothetical protein